MIAFFGMGLLGSNFVRAYLRRGEEVRVWNRTVTKARALEADGAKVFADPAEAAGARPASTSRSPTTLRWTRCSSSRGRSFAPGVVIVDHTTTSPTGTRARAERWSREGVEFQHAPVFMGPQNALESTGVMLASGDPARVERLRPALEKMTGKLVYFGPEPERAASFKLFGNLFLMFMTAGVAEVLTLAKALDVKPEDAAALFDVFNRRPPSARG